MDARSINLGAIPLVRGHVPTAVTPERSRRSSRCGGARSRRPGRGSSGCSAGGRRGAGRLCPASLPSLRGREPEEEWLLVAPARRMGGVGRRRAAPLADVRTLPSAAGGRDRCGGQANVGATRPWRIRTRGSSLNRSRRDGGRDRFVPDERARAGRRRPRASTTTRARRRREPGAVRSRLISSRRSSSSGRSMRPRRRRHGWVCRPTTDAVDMSDDEALRSKIELASGGYRDQSAVALEEAVTEYERLGLEFDRARSLLSLGRARRRARKWGAARESLEQAASLFDAMGSAGWADRARSELDPRRRAEAEPTGRADGDRATRRPSSRSKGCPTRRSSRRSLTEHGRAHLTR